MKRQASKPRGLIRRLVRPLLIEAALAAVLVLWLRRRQTKPA